MTDTERLDWLEASQLEVAIEDLGHGQYGYYAGPHHRFSTLRELIDAIAVGEDATR